MTLTPEERDLIKGMIDRGEPLPDDYRFRLFREPREAELIWPGKTHEVTQAVLPFQSIEQIDEPRVETEHAYGGDDLFSVGRGGRQAGGWSNKLIWGDNKLVLSSLKGGPLRKQIEDVGGLKLVYIDPPFDVGADFSFKIEVGEETLEKDSSVIEEIAYRDTWGRGIDSYVAMASERIRLIHDLLAEDGSLFLHCDWRVSAQLRLVLDEIFGPENFRNEIYWYYYNKMPDTRKGQFPRSTDTIFWYVKDRKSSYTFSPLTEEREKSVKQLVRKKVDGRMVNARDESGNVLYNERTERVVDNVWRLSMLQPADRTENLFYATQKPEHLVARIIDACSKPGDLVADFFCGSGTTLAVAEKKGRKWIGADLGRFAIHTTRKRMIRVQRELKLEGSPYRSFEILNLGKYDRQWFAGIDPNLPDEQRRAIGAAKEARYLDLILQAYSAQTLDQSPPFHGTKEGAFVFVGPVDAPVTEAQVSEAVGCARRMNVSRIDILGFEFEMGLSPRAVDEARAKGVAVALRYIPKDVFDRRAVERGQVSFYDLAYVEAKAEVVSKKDRGVTVSLTNFGVNYRQEDVEALIAALGKNKSKVTVDGGQVVKISTDKEGAITREILTKEWTDWIDYWAVDFDYHSRPETLWETITLPDGTVKHVQQYTGGYIFENEWQSFRTKRDRKLELTSATHTYDRPGRHVIAVKVIDIFGNDTTKVFGVEV